MTEYLSQYLASDDQLQQQEQELRQTMAQSLRTNDRLRAFLQLYLLAKCAMEQLDKIDKKGFVQQLLDDVARERTNLDKHLAERAGEVRLNLDKLTSQVEEVKAELHQHDACIRDVLQGLGEKGNTERINSLKDSISQQMEELEANISAIVNIRQQESFLQMCALADAQTRQQ